MGVALLLLSIFVTLIKTGYMAYHYLGHYIDKDSPNFEKLLERAVHEAYKKGKSKSKKSEDEAASTDKEEPSYMPSEMMLVSIASESMVNTSSPRSRQFTQRTESEFTS
uniref:Nematode cuticle collagen N-terminal domain-containing protein n=1 Tax=Ascaris lumbricoides TaxID=6252 RepID=A0A0M3ILH8_ASCLU